MVDYVFVLDMSEFKDDIVHNLKPRIEFAIAEASRTVCARNVVTASVGSAFCPQDGATAEQLLAEADRLMYESKEKHYKRGAGAGRFAEQELDSPLRLPTTLS